MKSHTGERRHRRQKVEKRFKCQECDYECGTQSGLKMHMTTHTGKKPYRCNICDFNTSYSSSLRNHVRNHEGTNPHKCELCDYAAPCPSALKQHAMVHTGERYNMCYTCNECGFSCGGANTLRKHKLLHENESKEM